jgi:hypothetical protein
VVLLAIGAFQRPSSQRLLHYWSPSSFHLFPVCWQLQWAYYPDFARVEAPRSAPSGFVQRTGCSACGLGYPHQVLVGSPHVHSSLLVPVSFAGFLIKCIRVYWQSLPQCRFAWPFSRRVGFSSRCFPSVAHSVFCLPRICGATRLLSLAGYLFLLLFLFHFLIYFISHVSAPQWWWLSGLVARAFLSFVAQAQSLAHTHVSSGSSPMVGPLFFWPSFWLFHFLLVYIRSMRPVTSVA